VVINFTIKLNKSNIWNSKFDPYIYNTIFLPIKLNLLTMKIIHKKRQGGQQNLSAAILQLTKLLLFPFPSQIKDMWQKQI
jgi:hypothetical protein